MTVRSEIAKFDDGIGRSVNLGICDTDRHDVQIFLDNGKSAGIAVGCVARVFAFKREVLCVGTCKRIRERNRAVCRFRRREDRFRLGKSGYRVVLSSAETNVFAHFAVACFDKLTVKQIVSVAVELFYERFVVRRDGCGFVRKESDRDEILLEVHIERIAFERERIACYRVFYLAADV